MKEYIRKILAVLAVRAYDRVLVRLAPDVFLTRGEVQGLEE